jgi:Tfp pilus assembly protein PilF
MGRKLLYLAWSYEIPNNKSFAFVCEQESRLLRDLPVRWWLLLALAAVGAAAAHAGDRRLTWWIAAFLVLYAVGVVLFFVNGRFRLPMWPALAVLAGGALPAVIDAVRARQPRKLAVYAVTFLLVAVLSSVDWTGVEPPGYARDYFFRSLAHLEKGDLEQARDDARRSLEIDPDDPAVHFQLGNVALAAGDDQSAFASYLEAASRAPDEPRIFNNLGIVYERRDLPGEAYRTYQAALALAPDYGPALVNAALLELRSGLLERATDKLQRAAASGFDALPLTCARAFLAREHGREAEARELLEEARRRNAEAVARLERQQRHRLDALELDLRPQRSELSAPD